MHLYPCTIPFISLCRVGRGVTNLSMFGSLRPTTCVAFAFSSRLALLLALRLAVPHACLHCRHWPKLCTRYDARASLI